MAIGSPVRPYFSYEKVQIFADENLKSRGIKEGDTLKLRYTRGTLRLYAPYLGKIVTQDGAVYHGQEISFHVPSQHTIHGEKFDMEMQIVHYGKSIGDTDKQVILSFMFKKAPGVYNKFLNQLDIFNLPNPLDDERDLQKILYIPDILFNLNEESPSSMVPFSFYTYEGSLTRPPCSEKTIHFVASQPIGLSATVISLFKESLRIPDLQAQDGTVMVNETSILHSNRITQNLYGRNIFYYDSKRYACLSNRKLKKPSTDIHKSGHYERKISKQESYIFVEGDKPSGLPNSFVVTEKEAKGVDEKKSPDEEAFLKEIIEINNNTK